MFDAQYLIQPVTASVFKIYGPWMSRGGDNATFALDLIDETMSNGYFEIDIYTKASEDAGDGASATGDSPEQILHSTGPKRYTWEVNGGMKELVRYEFTLTADVGTGERVFFRMLAPSWFDSVDT